MDIGLLLKLLTIAPTIGTDIQALQKELASADDNQVKLQKTLQILETLSTAIRSIL